MDLVAQAVERNAEAVEENDMQTRPGSGLGSKVLRARETVGSRTKMTLPTSCSMTTS